MVSFSLSAQDAERTLGQKVTAYASWPKWRGVGVGVASLTRRSSEFTAMHVELLFFLHTTYVHIVYNMHTAM